MQDFKIATLFFFALTYSAMSCAAVDVTLGTWLEEDVNNLSSVSGSGNTFTAVPGASGLDSSDDFADRLEAWQRVYQFFDQPVDFSSADQNINVTFDVEFNGTPKQNDTDFRISFIDTESNQGFYSTSFDLGARVGTYNRARFVDNLDGANGDPTWDAWGGTLVQANNGTGTVAQSSGAPTLSNGAVDVGLIDGNVVSFDLFLKRNAGNSFLTSANITESNGDVVYPEVVGTYDPVNPTVGDTDVSGNPINQIDGIVFGIMDDNPFAIDGDYNADGSVDAADYTVWRDNFGAAEGTLPNDPNAGAIGSLQYDTWVANYGIVGSYTVTNINITATAFVAPLSATTVPEPASLTFLLLGTSLMFVKVRK